jgi:hypothetical protein
MLDLTFIDVAAVVNLATLRDILGGLRAAGRKWWIASDPADALSNGYITVGYGDPACRDRLNTIYYRLPVINDHEPPGGTDQIVMLIDASVVSPQQAGIYLEHDRLCSDEPADIEDFLVPITRALSRRLGGDGERSERRL